MMQRKLLTRSDVEQVGISTVLFPLVLVMSSCLVSCSKTQSVDNHRAGDPVLAIVGGDEITLSAVNAELKPLDGREGDTDAQHQKQVLEALIDRDILARDAASRKIDRDPAVLDAIDREKAKILVNAYMQGLIAATPKPTQQDIDRYYRDHPFLFAERKLFKSDELIIHDVAARQQAITMSDAGNSMHQILLWLDQHDAPYILKQRMITGDKLPTGFVEMTGNLVDGKPFIVKNESDFQIWAMTELSLQPLDEDAVKQQIEQTLINQKARNELAAEVAKLRVANGVVYSDALRINPHDTHLAANDGRNANGIDLRVQATQGVQK